MGYKFREHATTLTHSAMQAVIFGEILSDEPLDEGDMGHSQVYEFRGRKFCIEGYTNGHKLIIQEVTNND